MPNLLGKTHSFTSCTISSLQIILACQNAFPHVCAHLMPKGEKNMNLLADRVYKSELEAQLSPVSCKRNRTTLDFFPNFCFFLFFCQTKHRWWVMRICMFTFFLPSCAHGQRRFPADRHTDSWGLQWQQKAHRAQCGISPPLLLLLLWSLASLSLQAQIG